MRHRDKAYTRVHVRSVCVCVGVRGGGEREREDGLGVAGGRVVHSCLAVAAVATRCDSCA